MTGLRQPNIHNDVAFLFFDVSSSYHCKAEFTKCWIVHPLIGNVSWVWTVVRQVSFTLLTKFAAIVILLITRGTAGSDNLQLAEKAMLRSYNLLDFD